MDGKLAELIYLIHSPFGSNFPSFQRIGLITRIVDLEIFVPTLGNGFRKSTHFRVFFQRNILIVKESSRLEGVRRKINDLPFFSKVINGFTGCSLILIFQQDLLEKRSLFFSTNFIYGNRDPITRICNPAYKFC